MKFIISFCFSLISLLSYSQKSIVPVDWSFEVIESGDDLTLRATADIEDKWAIYSQHTGEGGPIALSFTFDDPSTLIGETEEISEPIKVMSKLFEVEVIKFKKQAIFEQKFSKKKGMKTLSGEVRFMSCDESRCLPPTDVRFDIEL